MATVDTTLISRPNPYADPDFRQKVRESSNFLRGLWWNGIAKTATDLHTLLHAEQLTCDKCGKVMYLIGVSPPPMGPGVPPIVFHCPDCFEIRSFRYYDPAWWLLREQLIGPDWLQAKKDKAKRHFATGREFLRCGDYSHALVAFQRAAKCYSSDAAIHYNLGIARRHLGDHAGARRAFHRAADLEYTTLEYVLSYGEALLDADSYRDAERVFDEAVDQRLRERLNWTEQGDPRAQGPDRELVRAYIGQGIVYQHTRRHREALDAFLKALAEDPQHSRIHWHLGRAYHQLGQPQEAATAFEIASLRVPNRAEIHYELGCEYMALRLFDPAADCFQTAVRLKPDFPEAQLALAYTFDELQRADEALVLYEYLVEHYPDCIPAYNAIGMSYHARGDEKMAVAWLNRAIEAGPDDPIGYYSLGFVYRENGHLDEAIAPLEQAWTRLHFPDAGYLLAKTHIDRGWYDQAETVLRQVRLLQKNDPDVLFLLGMALYYQNKYKRAERVLEQAVQLNPNHAEAWQYLGFVRVQIGTPDEVKSIVTHLKALDKDMAGAVIYAENRRMQAIMSKIRRDDGEDSID
jgi:tetratricopeptide (TPR) repeat protein